MPETKQLEPVEQFTYHVCTVGAIAVLAITLGAYDPNGPAPPPNRPQGGKT